MKREEFEALASTFQMIYSEFLLLKILSVRACGSDPLEISCIQKLR